MQITKNFVDNLKDNVSFNDYVDKLYGGGIDYQAARYKKIYDLHVATYDGEVSFYSSPGRIELCGNHTDHNNGKVLCASITVDTVACVTPLKDKVVVASIGYPEVVVNLNELEPSSEEYGSSEALVRGVLAYYKQNSYNIGGFAATTSSDVFKGAGVSSSASFEVLICEILNQMYNGGVIDKITKAKAAHYAESIYFGKPCGLLDQSAISLGGVSFIDFKSTVNPKVKSMEWNFDDASIVLINTGGDHCDLTSQYADIRSEMEWVASMFHARKLRKVKEEEFLAAIPELQKQVSGRAILRAMHFFEENKRVETGVRAVKSGNFKKFAAVINGSGQSSYELLQNCYPLGDTVQRIPLALAVSKLDPHVKAARVHGGGFAGTILAFVDNEGVDGYVADMKKIFGDDCVYRIGVRNEGTCKVELN